MEVETDIARDVVDTVVKSVPLSLDDSEGVVRAIALMLAEKFQAIMPTSGQSCVVQHGTPKTAALYFDRVWGAPSGGAHGIPREVVFFGGSKPELWLTAFAVMRYSLLKKNPNLNPVDISNVPWDNALEKHVMELSKAKADQGRFTKGYLSTNLINRVLAANCSLRTSTMFSDSDTMDREYVPGDGACILAAITGLGVVDEVNLSWQQVLEFRGDPEARSKLRRMRKWLDSEMVGKSASQIADVISTRLEDYNWSIKKHGIQTLTGAVSDLLSPPFVAATGTLAAGIGFAAGTGLAELATGGIAVGRAVISIVDRYINLGEQKHIQGSDIAFVHELKKLSK